MQSILQAIAGFAVVAGILLLFTWGLNRGGKGKTQGQDVVFKPRPVIYVVMAITIGLGLLLWGLSIVSILNHEWAAVFWTFVFGLPLILLGLFAGLQSVTLSTTGITYHRWFLEPIQIAWTDLSHYEIEAAAQFSVLVLRPRVAGRTIALSSYAFSPRSILQNITRYSAIRQQPFKRTSWWKR